MFLQESKGTNGMCSETRSFETDSRLEYKFAKTIKAILGNQFIGKDIEADLNEGTDFLVFRLEPIRVACRLRRFQYLKYEGDFTIRWSRPSGVDTEYQKVMKGLVDYILYGFVDQQEKQLISYFIGDLKVFRDSGIEPLSVNPNNPNDSELAIFRIKDLPKNFVIKQFRRKPDRS